MSQRKQVRDLRTEGLGRRRLIERAGLGMAGAAVLAAGGVALPTREAMAQTLTDADILNFALNLEYLEAEYYLHGVFGHGLPAKDSTGVGTVGKVIGGSKVSFTNKTYEGYAAEVAADEYDHVLFLRAALGSAAVARPEIDLLNSFNALAVAAGLGSSFNPFADQKSFLLGAYVFEDVGVTAYLGAVPAISSKTYLSAAAGIMGTEAYHAGEVRTRLYEIGYFEQTAKISALRAKASGAADDQGIRVKGKPNIVPTDANGITFARTPQQVLNIVYLDHPGGGAFFPMGMNGTIH